MGRRAKGTVIEEGGRFYARVSAPNSKLRPRVPLPLNYTRAQAEEKAAEIAAYVKVHGIDAILGPRNPTRDETVRDYGERWVQSREEAGVRSARDDRTRLVRHVYPVILPDGTRFGDRAAKLATRADLEAVVEALDAKARRGEYREVNGKRRTFGWKTATLTWCNISTMFGEASESKLRALRIRNDNPAEKVSPPDRGVTRAKNYVYPSEFSALVACERVPLRMRRIYAVTTYLYIRAGELEALKREDIDLEHGRVHIHQATDRVRARGEIKSTKSGRSRRVPIESTLVPLLTAMLRDGKTGPLVNMPSPGEMSENLRTHLRMAGVTRADLFDASKTRKPVTFHDLRASGVTWRAVRGDEPLAIMTHAGHRDFKTTLGYIREAENLSAGFGDVFPALPASLGIASEILTVASAPIATALVNKVNSGVGVTGFEKVRGSAGSEILDRNGAGEVPSRALSDRSDRDSVRWQDIDLSEEQASWLLSQASFMADVEACKRAVLAQDEGAYRSAAARVLAVWP